MAAKKTKKKTTTKARKPRQIRVTSGQFEGLQEVALAFALAGQIVGTIILHKILVALGRPFIVVHAVENAVQLVGVFSNCAVQTRA